MSQLSDEAILQTHELSKSFGRQKAVDGLTLTVRRGDIYGFLGLNGAGKTTTIRMVLGLMRRDAGKITLFGDPRGPDHRPHLGRIGAMVEGPAFYGPLSGAENLALLARLTAPVSEKRIADILATVGLAEAKDKKARDYSLGMKQRLGIALALVSEPELVILDEPTNGLDPNGILEMRRLIQDLNAERGVTFLISSHLLHEIEIICNRVAIIERGRLVTEDAVATLLERHSGMFVLDARPTSNAAAAVRASGAEAVETGIDGRLSFRLDRDRLPGLHVRLHEAGIEVFTLSESRTSLESIFLAESATRREGSLS